MKRFVTILWIEYTLIAGYLHQLQIRIIQDTKMEAMAIILMLMKPDHSMMELGKYKSMEQCEQAMQVAKTQFKKGHLSCLKKGEKMKMKH